MSVNPDFRDLFATLNAAQAEFLIVGSYALAVHGVPGFTKGLDVWVEANSEHAQKVWSALDAFGAPFGDLTLQDLSTQGIIFQWVFHPIESTSLHPSMALNFRKHGCAAYIPPMGISPFLSSASRISSETKNRPVVHKMRSMHNPSVDPNKIRRRPNRSIDTTRFESLDSTAYDGWSGYVDR